MNNNNERLAKELIMAYYEANDCTLRDIAKGIKVAPRRARSIVREETIPTEDEAFNIMSWLKGEGFDYIPPKVEKGEPIAEKEESKPKKKAISDKTTSVSIKGTAKQDALDFKRIRGYRHDYESASVLVRIGWETVVREGIKNIDFSKYE